METKSNEKCNCSHGERLNDEQINENYLNEKHISDSDNKILNSFLAETDDIRDLSTNFLPNKTLDIAPLANDDLSDTNINLNIDGTKSTLNSETLKSLLKVLLEAKGILKSLKGASRNSLEFKELAQQVKRIESEIEELKLNLSNLSNT